MKNRIAKITLRKQWAAAVAFVLLFTIFFAAGNFSPVVLADGLIYWALMVFLLIRLGLLAMIA